MTKPTNPIAPDATPPESFQFSRWRHGGWYVDNVRYPSGACGCVSRNYDDRKWRIVCHPRASYDDAPTFNSRDEAALAEWHLAQAEGRADDPADAGPKCSHCGNDGTKGALYLTVDARYMPETRAWRIVERDDDGGMELDCLACDHRTPVDGGDGAPPSHFPYETDLPAKEA